MTDPNSTTGFRVLLRDPQGPVTCATCGCRLQAVGPDGAQAFFHFGARDGRDARGCRVDCSDQAHDDFGRAHSA